MKINSSLGFTFSKHSHLNKIRFSPSKHEIHVTNT